MKNLKDYLVNNLFFVVSHKTHSYKNKWGIVMNNLMHHESMAHNDIISHNIYITVKQNK
jgi:hypothetical protein